MASSRVLEREVQEESKTATPDFCPHKYSLLVIIGRTSRHRQTEHIRQEIERGIRSWDVDLKSCNLNLFLQEFLSRHTASFKGAGQKCLRHCTKVLDTQVLISPSQELAYSEVFALLSKDSAHKLLILAGLSVEESGELLFHRGQFSPGHLRRIITEQFPDQESSSFCVPPTKISLTLSCPNIGHWRKTLPGNPSLQGPFTLRINPPEILPAMESLGEFTSLISGTICPASPFDLLPPPTTVGFLKLSRPCCYVFPAGRGDCAFFAVNGFTLLVDGGSDSQACFWKLVRHLDRVDAVLLTHVGTESLPGAVSFLERKVAEKELSCDVKDDLSKRLISPELGVVFFNAPSRLLAEQLSFADNVLESTQQAATTLQLLKKLDIRPQPMFRPQGVPIKPITLFQKMGVGQLDLYILSPGKSSQEYETFMQNWPDGDSSSQCLPLATLVSVSALLVWHPACPQEKVVRVLFPGATPQAKLLQGLEKLKGLEFLQKPTVTTGDLERQGEDRKAKRTESLDSGRSIGKEGTTRQGKERGAREEGKDASVKEKGKTLSGTKDSDKAKVKEAGLKRKPSLSEKNTLKKGKDGKKEEKTGNKEENSIKRTEQIKRDVPSKTKKDNKTKPKKDARNDKTADKKMQKSSASNANKDKKGQANNNSKEQKQGSLSDISEPGCPGTDKQNHKRETEVEEKQHGSKVSTPEDMTAEFLRLREESELEVAELETAACGDLGRETHIGGFGEDACNKRAERFIEEAAVGLGVAKVEDGKSLAQNVPGKSSEPQADLQRNRPDESVKSSKPAKVVGFPSPLNKSYNGEHAVQQDTTPTEYTLLDGALRHSPPSHSSPENQAPISPDEETVEPVSADSRPNSAGHTPYCLSPDDVWCNKATLSRLQALHSADAYGPNGSSRLSEEQVCKTKSATENTKEKHLSFLSLGTCREGSSDPSPSVATTTTTTHSLPAEVSSPQSTEVDESLSMSFEQGPTAGSQREGDDGVYLSHSNGGYYVGKSLPMKMPPRSLGQTSELGRPAAPNTLHFEGSAHDVDLCLVSPCEFKHFKAPDSSSGASEGSRDVSGPNHQGINNNNPKDRSPSESNAPVCTEDCPSTTADGALDLDSDDSCSDPSNSPCNHNVSQTLPPDPLPAPLRDSPPLPPHPDTSMPVPQSDSEAHGKRVKATAARGKHFPGIIDAPQKSGSGKIKTGSQSGAMKGNLFSSRTLSSSTRAAPAKSSPAPSSKAPSAGEVSVYVDLTYIPSGASSPTVTVDFFRCIRSSCYIISGNSPQREELMRETLDALLDGKTSWPGVMQVTVIPTFESASMQEWYQQTLDRQRELSITVLGSNSTVAMQDETFPACKIEF